MRYTDADEEAYHKSLEHQYNEIRQYSAFVSIRWGVLKLMVEWGISLDYKGYCYLRKVIG